MLGLFFLSDVQINRLTPSEVLNVTASLERLIAALNWFSREEGLRSLIHNESFDVDGPLIVLTGNRGPSLSRQEVVDTAELAYRIRYRRFKNRFYKVSLYLHSGRELNVS